MKRAPVMLALVTDAFGGRGGIAQYNRDFLAALAGTGTVSSIIVLPRHAPDRVVLPPGIGQIPPRLSRIAYAFTALRAVLFRRVDLVFCGHMYMAPLGAIIAWVTRAKLIVQMHGIEAWPRPSRLRRAAVEGCDLVLSVSRHTRARVLGWAKIAPERVLVLPNTVETAFTPGDNSALRSAWGLTGKRVLLTVGRLAKGERYKGHDQIVSALPRLVAEGYDVVYLVVGEGDDRSWLENFAREMGVVDRVRFLGAVGQQGLVNAYRVSDLFVMPSTREGFGIVFLEAMACGVPTLGLAVAGAIDPLADGDLGTAVTEIEFPAALSEALGRPRHEPAALASAVQSRFGRDHFALLAGTVIRRLMEVPSRHSRGNARFPRSASSDDPIHVAAAVASLQEICGRSESVDAADD
jgi:phosphatidyl-myo-inositol dimannoside synthase